MGAGRLDWRPCLLCSLLHPPTTPCLPHTAGAEAAFVATLSARPTLLATLRACLTPQQVLVGAAQSLTPAAQVGGRGG